MALSYTIRITSLVFGGLVLAACGGSGTESVMDDQVRVDGVAVEQSLPADQVQAVQVNSAAIVNPADTDDLTDETNTDAGFVSESENQPIPDAENQSVEPGCVSAGSAGREVSVLLIGNSLMNDVQSKLEKLLKCGGYITDLATSNPGGYWLHQHLDNTHTTELIAKGYDLTLVQEQSRSIATHMSPYGIINTLKQRIEAAGSVMGFYQTWGYQNRDVALTDEILLGYENLAAVFDAPVVHIGRAWDHFYTSYNDAPPFSLYLDYAHATPHGKAMIAYVLYAYLTGESPVNLPTLSLPADEALELQSVAWHIYQTNL